MLTYELPCWIPYEDMAFVPVRRLRMSLDLLMGTMDQESPRLKPKAQLNSLFGP
jgi:hypothetical protein